VFLRPPAADRSGLVNRVRLEGEKIGGGLCLGPQADHRGGPVAPSRSAAAIFVCECKMILELDSLIPLTTILGAAAAPTIAAIWAENRRKRDVKMAVDLAVVTADNVAEVRETLVGSVNDQLSDCGRARELGGS
jgi:hypothetical protein